MIAFVLLVITSIAVGGVAFTAVQIYSEARYRVERSHEVITTVNEALDEVQDLESAQDGYLQSGKLEFLTLSRASTQELEDRLLLLLRLSGENKERQKAIHGIEAVILPRAEVVRQLLTQRTRVGELQPAQLVLIGSGTVTSQRVKSALTAMKAREEQQLSVRNKIANLSEFRIKLCLSGLVGLLLLFLVGSYLLVRRDYAQLTARELELSNARSDLEKVNLELKTYLADANKQARQMETLNELGKLLQSSASTEDAYDLFKGFLPKLLPGYSGVLMIISPSRKIIGTEAVAGNPSLNSQVMDLESCWALRRGQPCVFNTRSGLSGCRHMRGNISYVCFPLTSNGEPIGVIQIQSENGMPDEKVQLAATLADEFSLALGNLRLRETLREQSIRDSLTGLFNRRYMEETLERELARAKRSRSNIAVIMLDVDHFKKLNDRHGHQVGDKLLREFGRVIRSAVRVDDIACRYGGEEFTVLMPGADLESAQERCERIRALAANISVDNADREPVRCTVSIGLSVFPTHGRAVSRLVRAADEALYRAKANGRDRVEVAQAERIAPIPGKDHRPGLPM